MHFFKPKNLVIKGKKIIISQEFYEEIIYLEMTLKNKPREKVNKLDNIFNPNYTSSDLKYSRQFYILFQN